MKLRDNVSSQSFPSKLVCGKMVFYLNFIWNTFVWMNFRFSRRYSLPYHFHSRNFVLSEWFFSFESIPCVTQNLSQKSRNHLNRSTLIKCEFRLLYQKLPHLYLEKLIWSSLSKISVKNFRGAEGFLDPEVLRKWSCWHI